MRRALFIVALISISVSPSAAQDLSSTKVFEGATTMTTKAGVAESVHLSVQSWGIRGERGGRGAPQEIPLRGFYLAHLLSGEISAIVDGETTRRSPGDYWAVKPGGTMQVKTLGDFAMLETIVVSK
jgi:quercetin dioxygenase-like cupin family protein